MKKELLFMGPPASGKGTYTRRLSQETGLPHVDTGSLLRAAIKNGTEAGLIAKSYIDKGQLAPIEIVARIIKERLLEDDCKNGFILDGFPRSIEQALALDEIKKEIDNGEVAFKVINFEIGGDILLERIVNRVSCPACGEIYNNKFTPPKKAGICDKCGTALMHRKDDTAEVAQSRFETYYRETAPLIDFYEKRGELIRLDVTGNGDEVYKRIKEIIK